MEFAAMYVVFICNVWRSLLSHSAFHKFFNKLKPIFLNNQSINHFFLYMKENVFVPPYFTDKQGLSLKPQLKKIVVIQIFSLEGFIV